MGIKRLISRLGAHVADATVHISALTASRAVATNASGALVASATSDTELGYVDGVTSAIQTQLDGKAATDRALDAMGATTDITTLDATASAHGLLPKLDGVATNFLKGDGTWGAAGGGQWDRLGTV